MKHKVKVVKKKISSEKKNFLVIAICLSSLVLIGFLSTIYGIYLINNVKEAYSQGEDIYEAAKEYREVISDREKEDLDDKSDSKSGLYGPYDIDFESLKEVNDDVVAWIKIEGTSVDYPVVYSKDNIDYLNITYDLQKSIYGAIFMDCANKRDFSSANTIIYGHNMKNGSMFKTINYYYDDGSYLKEHSEIWICTSEKEIKYRVIAAFRTKCYSDAYFTDFELGSSEYETWLNSQVMQSKYKCSDVDISLPVVTLSTCCKSHSDERTVLMMQPCEEYETK